MAAKKIIVIEDNTEMRENIAEILDLSGYEVLSAENGKSGVQLVQLHLPDLVICDIMMPELDGYGVLRILSRNPLTASIPFIFLTAKAEQHDFRKGMSLGADDYITKPFEDLELLDAIEIRLNKSSILSTKFDKSIEGLQKFFNDAKAFEELKELSSNREIRYYRKKEIIFLQGGYPKQLFFVNKGKAKTYKCNDGGKEYVTGLLSEGDFFGYRAMLKESKYYESASAIDDCEVCTIPKEDFYSLMYRNRDVSYKFIKLLANDLADAEMRLLNLAYDSVRKRVADGLLLLEKKYNPENGHDYLVSVLREDLASIVGTAKESVIRTLGDFKEEGLIEIHEGDIVIKERELLKNLAG